MHEPGLAPHFPSLTTPCALIALISCVGPAPQPAERVEATELEVKVKDGLLSVELGEVPVSEVLEAIGDQAKLEINVRGDLGSVRPQVFENVPLAEGIRRLVGSDQVNLVMRYEVDETGEKRLAAVRVRKAREVPAEERAEQRESLSLSRIKPPPPLPPPPDIPVLGSP